MRTRTQLLALGLVVVLVTSVGGAQVGTAPTSAPTGDGPATNLSVDTEPSSANATTIESCSEINESGHYELGSDIGGASGACITITASDVVLDGNGHTIETMSNGVWAEGNGTLTNVTVRNLRVDGVRRGIFGTVGIQFENVSDATISNYTFDGGYVGVSVRNSTDLVVHDVTATGQDSMHGPSFSGIFVRNTTDATITGGEVWMFKYGISASGENVTIRNNTVYQDFGVGLIGEYSAGISVSTSNSEIVGNDIRAKENGYGDGIRLDTDTSSTRVAENTIAFDGRSGVRVNTTGTGDASNVITNNTFDSVGYGVYVVQNSNPLRVEHNEFADTTTGIRVGHWKGCYLAVVNASTVSAHQNAFVGTPVGVDNIDDEVLNATQNYWGASTGPSSADDPDAPFEDRETGALADGDGASVSEHPDEDGVSNVHFDPALTEPPAEAGADGDEDENATN